MLPEPTRLMHTPHSDRDMFMVCNTKPNPWWVWVGSGFILSISFFILEKEKESLSGRRTDSNHMNWCTYKVSATICSGQVHRLGGLGFTVFVLIWCPCCLFSFNNMSILQKRKSKRHKLILLSGSSHLTEPASLIICNQNLNPLWTLLGWKSENGWNSPSFGPNEYMGHGLTMNTHTPTSFHNMQTRVRSNSLKFGHRP